MRKAKEMQTSDKTPPLTMFNDVSIAKWAKSYAW